MNYPEEPAGPFEGPPRRFEDAEGREIVVRECGTYHGPDEEHEELVEMYLDFDPEDRAQGIPPLGEQRVRRWLDVLLAGECFNVVAWYDARPVGHATLVPDDGDYELAIFVLQGYQNAGIGTRLLETLLGLGERQGVDRVWLSVERWNDPAVALYEKVGFKRTGDGGFELKMTARLAPEAA